MTRNPHSRPDQQLIALARYIENLAHRRPIARRTASERLGELDGFTGGNDEPIVTATSELTAPERIANARVHLTNLIDAEQATVREVATLAAELGRLHDRMIADRTPTVETAATQRCNCAGREGHIDPWVKGARLEDGNGWADPTCTNIASRGPLCDNCSAREYRWREYHDLGARTDGVFSGDVNVYANV